MKDKHCKIVERCIYRQRHRERERGETEREREIERERKRDGETGERRETVPKSEMFLGNI